MSITKTVFVGVTLTLSAATLAQPGTIDPTFNGGQPSVVSWGNTGGYGTLNAVVVQSTGKAVAVGKPAPTALGAIRFNLDGSVDTTFGQGGTFDQPYVTSSGTGLVPPFQIVAGGAVGAAVGPADRIVMIDGSFQLVCLTADGALDTTFGSGGRLSMYTLGNRYWSTAAVAYQADGKIVVAGYSIPQHGNGSYGASVARLNPNGTLDTTFANIDRHSTPGYLIDTQAGNILMPRATLVIQPDGRILIATSSSDSQPFLARYLPTGAPDTSFGVGGKRTFSFSGGRDPAKGLALTSDGHIVLEAAQGQLLYAARYSANGVLDGTFGGSSTGWIALTIPASASPGYGIALQSDNSVLIPVSWPDGGMDSSDQAVIRLTPSGALDSGFGVSGLSQTVGWVGQNESSRALTIDSAGRIILAGSHFDGTAGWIMVAAIRSQ